MSAITTAGQFVVRDIKRKEVELATVIGGKVALIVNVASKCGFTPQYKGLEELYQKYKDRGFVVVGFPCNQFGGQEPGSEEQIESDVCSLFKATFPVMAKVDVNGDAADPLWKWMKAEKPGLLGRETINWFVYTCEVAMMNFAKFLIDRNGKVIERYLPTTEPKGIAKDIEKLL